jgi:hypothetical protein
MRWHGECQASKAATLWLGACATFLISSARYVAVLLLSYPFIVHQAVLSQFYSKDLQPVRIAFDRSRQPAAAAATTATNEGTTPTETAEDEDDGEEELGFEGVADDEVDGEDELDAGQEASDSRTVDEVNESVDRDELYVEDVASSFYLSAGQIKAGRFAVTKVSDLLTPQIFD